jgi:RNA-binding protein
MNLSNDQQKFLRKLAQNLDPVVWIGQNGLTDNVVDELNGALDNHELVKVKIRVGDRTIREQTITSLCGEEPCCIDSKNR